LSQNRVCLNICNRSTHV